ncbi:MAG: hypothetical protein RLY31_2966 [Bacteroidota bacterium]|jgi:alkaline phosphatase D
MRIHFPTLLTACMLTLAGMLSAQRPSLLQSGPMLGYSEMKEVLIWVQTNREASVQVEYWPTDQPALRHQTDTYRTISKEGFTARLIADQVEPGLRYEYQLLINGEKIRLEYPTVFQTQTLWQWRTDPPPFKVALGSCSFVNEPAYDRPGRPYGAEYGIFTTIQQMRPDAMLWLGDNTYLREPDWFSRTGFLHRYTHTRSLPELQPLLASTHHYAIWDDHDYGQDNSDGSFVHKDLATDIFRLFWGNPTCGLPGQGGTTSAFKWADMDFFLLDNRYFRTANNRKTGVPTLLGEIQLEWLVNALVSSRAPFKFVAVGGQVLNTHAGHETYINLAPEERAFLLKRIEEEGIRNVVFLTGDRHHTELSKLTLGNGIDVHDLTVSPLTSGTHQGEERNILREEGTFVSTRNFGMLEFDGPRTERTLTIRIYDSQGVEQWSRTIAPSK